LHTLIAPESVSCALQGTFVSGSCERDNANTAVPTLHSCGAGTEFIQIRGKTNEKNNPGAGFVGHGYVAYLDGPRHPPLYQNAVHV